ncbi:MAG: hypothetical protein ACERLM_07050 [Acidimicrobiales bacterium]
MASGEGHVGETVDGRTSHPRRLLMLHGRRGYWDVHGEARYATALARLAGPLGPDGPAEDRRHIVVELRPEPSHRDDPHAVAVVCQGEVLGYVPRDRTQRYHHFLHWARSAGWDGLRCRAQIIGGFRMGEGEWAHLGVALAHTEPFLAEYDGPLPTIADDPQTTDRINLIGEELHQQFLSDRAHQRKLAFLVVDSGWVVAEVDGVRIGSLTKKMSDRYAEGVRREIQRNGGFATCLCGIIPGPSKIEAHLKLPTGDALAAWART